MWMRCNPCWMHFSSFRAVLLTALPNRSILKIGSARSLMMHSVQPVGPHVPLLGRTLLFLDHSAIPMNWRVATGHSLDPATYRGFALLTECCALPTLPLHRPFHAILHGPEIERHSRALFGDPCHPSRRNSDSTRASLLAAPFNAGSFVSAHLAISAARFASRPSMMLRLSVKMRVRCSG